MRADRVPRMRSTEASFPENARLAIISTSDAADLPSTCTISVPFTFAMDGLRISSGELINASKSR
jgi:hypothetical protein